MAGYWLGMASLLILEVMGLSSPVGLTLEALLRSIWL